LVARILGTLVWLAATLMGQVDPGAELRALNAQVSELYGAGRLDEALPPAKKAVDLIEKAKLPDDAEAGTSFFNLGVLYKEKGDYERAQPLLERAVRIQETTGYPDQDSATYELASVYLARRELELAEPLCVKILSLDERVKGPDHPDTGKAATLLAGVYLYKGDYARAECLFERARFICEKTSGPDHTECAGDLNNLAALYLAQGEYVKAQPLLERAVEIWGKDPDLYSSEIAVAGNNLGSIYLSRGDYTKAGVVFWASMNIWERTKGPDNPDTASAASNLAWAFLAERDYSQAEPLFQRVLATKRKMLGPEHPETATALVNLSTLYLARGDRQTSAQFLARADTISERNLELILATGSEEQKRAYVATLQGNTEMNVSFHTRYAADDPAALRLALLTVIQRKGRVLEAVAAETNALRQRLEPRDRQLLDELMNVRRQRANLVLRGSGPPDPAKIRQLETREDQLGAEISSRSAEFRAESVPITLERLQAALPPNAALVELVHYWPWNPRRRVQNFAEAPRYAAYILFHAGDPSWADLGDARQIDQLARQLRAALSHPDREDARELARQLDALIMAPIRKRLRSTRDVRLSPDGQLNLVPFAALVDEEGRYLLERYTFTYLGSGRDLLRLEAAAASRQGPLVVANPDYEGSAAGGKTEAPMQFGPLPGTAQEAEALREVLGLTEESVLTGARATEGAVKRVSGPRVLHIATHGFFLEDAEEEPPDSRTFINLNPEGDRWPKAAGGANPLLRSGLALAGANRLESEGDDGILTALEASGLDLWGTQLVVLSACETGIGDVRQGEGVYGLRRALVLAGSRSQVMSLWKVSDAATRDLMAAYYRRLAKGESRSAALREVQREMLASRERSHPYYWAAFILSGESGPLGQ
jgi:CHAT domain-containing protein/Tfp pilus assembly protein PilF